MIERSVAIARRGVMWTIERQANERRVASGRGVLGRAVTHQEQQTRPLWRGALTSEYINCMVSADFPTPAQQKAVDGGGEDVCQYGYVEDVDC
jgi:hypothetical protein